MAIKEMPDFESVIRNDPLTTLSRVESLMHTPERAKYPSLTLIEVLLSWLNTKQGADEDLLDYLSRFWSERDVAMRLYDSRLIDGFVGRLPSFLSLSDVEREALRKRELNKFEASLFLRNADGDRYGDLLVEYRKAYANKECRYPTSVNDMMDVMRQQPRKNKDPIEGATLNGNDQGLDASSFVQTAGYACYCCGESKCRFHHCTQKGTLPREKWSNPEYFDKYQESKDKKMNAEELQKEEKQSHTIFKESLAQIAWPNDAAIDVSDDDGDFHVIFSG